MDEDEAGDMTDPRTGYDIKIIRSGSGKNDTTYSARACKPTKLDKKYSGNVDLESIVRSQIKDYDELEEITTWMMMNLRRKRESISQIFDKLVL